jgi:para-nitrobenzyl esterase
MLALGCLAWGCAAHAAPLSEIVQTQYGPVRGARSDILTFKGIPYAAPPIGDLRWRAPQPAKPWTDIGDTTGPEVPCPSAPGVFPGPAAAPAPSSEDCLNLNVWTAAKSTGEKRPVMVWIHGGGFAVGAIDPRTDGAAWARRGAVVVSMNYRLGALGFLAHPALSRESEHQVSGNYGLLDQIAALRWVKANIASFGGDPANVTLVGQSVGATSIAIMMVSPLADGLFHRAIMESMGFQLTYPDLWLKEARNGLVSAESDGAARAPDIAAFRKMSTEEVLLRLPSAPTVDAKGKHYNPVVDGYVLPDDLPTLLGRKPRSKIQVVIGHNADEGLFFAAGTPKTLSAYQDYVRAWFPLEPVGSVMQLYPAANDQEAAAAAIRFTGDYGIVAPTVLAARMLARFTDVHAYLFSRVGPFSQARWGGDAHGAELPYAHGVVRDPSSLDEAFQKVVAAGFDETDRKVSDAMAGAWVRFAATGDPNGPGLRRWPAYTAPGYQVLTFGDALTLGSNAGDRAPGYFEKAFAKMRIASPGG